MRREQEGTPGLGFRFGLIYSKCLLRNKQWTNKKQGLLQAFLFAELLYHVTDRVVILTVLEPFADLDFRDLDDQALLMMMSLTHPLLVM